MEGGSGVGSVASLTMDCEDMFKEITKKLYGEETSVGVGVGVVGVEFPAAERDLDDELRPEEHITAWGLAALMQNGFPPPGILQANFAPRTDPTAEDRWTAAEEPLAWAHSRIAAYNPAQRLFKCADCECVGFLARVAEHWLGTHSQARAFACPLAGCGFASGWARGVRAHLARDHQSDPAAADQLLRDNPALDDLTRYLQRLKNKVESMRSERRGAGGSGGAGEAGAADAGAAAGDGKRYACNACPYATDRRDLFTRHENIHRDEKPFHCYLCQKQFNRADHVKKHFLRMHRDQPYDLNRIRRSNAKPAAPAAAAVTAAPALHYYSKPPAEPPPAVAAAPAAPPPVEYRPAPAVKLERPLLGKVEPAAGPALHKPAASPATASAAAVRRKVSSVSSRPLRPRRAGSWPTDERVSAGRAALRVLLLLVVRRGQLVPQAAPQHAPEAVRVRAVRVQGGARRAAGHARAQGAQQEGVRQVPLPRRRPAAAGAPPARRPSHREPQPEGAREREPCGGGRQRLGRAVRGRGAGRRGRGRGGRGRGRRGAAARGAAGGRGAAVRLPGGVGRLGRRVRGAGAAQRVRAARAARAALRARQGERRAAAPRARARALPALLAASR